MDNIGIYVHIPFCIKKCKYCNFISFTNKSEKIPSYVDYLVREIETKSKEVTNPIDTIYIGGGTPSCVPIGFIPKILNAIYDNYNVLKNAEISIECNPNSITMQKAKEWLNCGINRVSVGLQTSNQNLLNEIGRIHSLDDYNNAISILKEVGFTNINSDMMIGLPNQKMKDVKRTIKVLVKNKITHISCYSLILEKNTPLYNEINSNKLKSLSDEKTIKMYSYSYKLLKKYGYNRYEVSNYAKQGYVCLHNTNCWNLHEYLGFGVSANGFYNNIRYSNATTIEDYISKIDLNGNSIISSEELTNIDKIEEYIMLGLRLKNGIDLKRLKDDFKYDLLNIKKDSINKLLNLNLIKIDNNRLYALDEGYYVLNQIILELI